MAVSDKAIPGVHQAPEAANLEWAYRSVVSSSQQKLFRTVLNQAQSMDPTALDEGVDSLQADLQKIYDAGVRGQKIDTMKQGGVRGPQPGEMNDLATSALLNLAAITGRRDQLAAYYSRAVATGRTAETGAAAQAGTSPSLPALLPSLSRQPGKAGRTVGAV